MQVWFWYKIRRLIMRFKQQLQLLSLLVGINFVQGCASLPGESGMFSPSENSSALSAKGSAVEKRVQLDLENQALPDAFIANPSEIRRELRALMARFPFSQDDHVSGDGFVRLSADDRVERLGSGFVQVGMVPDGTKTFLSTALQTDDRSHSSVVLSDRGEPLAEPRLDPPAEADQPIDGVAVLRPDYKDIWDRMRAGFALPALDSPLVSKHIQYYTHKPEYLERMFERGSRYLFYIVEEIERRGMPGELALLPFVESAMNPSAMSPAKAAGLWQFIPSTGKAYNLSQNWWVDNRRDPVHSTHAALDYLQKIYELQGNDWFLALASYNWGEGAVGRAMRKNQASGKPADYLSLNMPQETRHYVPKLMALREIVANPASFNVRLPSLPNKPYFVEVEAPLHLDLKLAARFAGMSEDEFVSLNPAHNRPVIAARTNDQIKIPADRVDSFLAAMKAHEDANKPFSRWRPYTLEQGESIQTLATKLGTSAQEIMRANGLRSAKVLPGTRLLAPSPDDKASAITVMTSFDGPRILEKVQRPAIYHRVGKKETTESIARRYGITAASLQAWNNLKHEVKLGMRLLVKPASAQTVLTNESGVSKVIATELVAPRASSDSNKEVAKTKDDAVRPKLESANPRDGAVKAQATTRPVVNGKPAEQPKTKPVKDQKPQAVDPNKAIKASNQAAKPSSQVSKPAQQPQASAEASKANGSNPNLDRDKSAKPKPNPDQKLSPDTGPKPTPRVTASSQSTVSLGLL